MSIFRDTLKLRLDEASIIYDDAQLKLCERYFALVVEANKSLNLTRITDEAEAAERHFADAAMLLKFFNIPHGARVIDVGSGAGFPGIPIKILRPDIDITLLDSVEKKIGFIKEASKYLRIEVKAVADRAEVTGNGQYREKFDIALSRAVAPLNILIELCIPLVRLNCVLAAWKGSLYSYEIEQSNSALRTLGCIISGTFPVGEGAIILVKKLKQTPENYPRRYSKIKSLPL